MGLLADVANADNPRIQAADREVRKAKDHLAYLAKLDVPSTTLASALEKVALAEGHRRAEVAREIFNQGAIAKLRDAANKNIDSPAYQLDECTTRSIDAGFLSRINNC